MEHLSFVLWLLLWPLVCATVNYINAKKKQIEGNTEKVSNGTKAFATILEIIIWIGVGSRLFSFL